MFRDYLPKKISITRKYALLVGKRIHDHNLWEYNIQSVPRGVAIGMFIAFIPLPIQMLLAIIFAILLRANVPLAVAATWITNPFTFIPISYCIHNLGERVLGVQHHDIIIRRLEFNGNWGEAFEVITNWAHTLGKPFLVGLPIVAFGVALFIYILITVIWFIVAAASSPKDRSKDK